MNHDVILASEKGTKVPRWCLTAPSAALLSLCRSTSEPPQVTHSQVPQDHARASCCWVHGNGLDEWRLGRGRDGQHTALEESEC